MRVLIFSDVHLSVAEDGRAGRERFIRFLRSLDAAAYDRIVILGDLFDFWFEYKHVIFSGYFDVLRALAELRDAGIQFDFVCGNHDLWAGRFLEQELAFTIHHESFRLELDGRRVLFLHGDGINPSDTGYRIYKRIARFGPVVWLFGLLHPDWAMQLAQWVSHGSRRLFQAEDLSQGAEVGPLRAYAEQALARGDADVVLLGHCHYPQQVEFPTPNGPGLYINTGDWLFHCSYVEWDGRAFALREFREDSEHVGAKEVAQHETNQSEQEHDREVNDAGAAAL